MFSLLTLLDIEVKAKERISVTREASLADWKSINFTSTGAGDSPPPPSSEPEYLNKIFDHQRSP